MNYKEASTGNSHHHISYWHNGDSYFSPVFSSTRSTKDDEILKSVF
jgi:hypothetical protein